VTTREGVTDNVAVAVAVACLLFVYLYIHVHFSCHFLCVVVSTCMCISFLVIGGVMSSYISLFKSYVLFL
jgi:hypothetical protein